MKKVRAESGVMLIDARPATSDMRSGAKVHYSQCVSPCRVSRVTRK